MDNNDPLHSFDQLTSPPSDTLSDFLKPNQEYPLYPSPASDISLKSLTGCAGGFGQREDGLTPSPYYAMLGCTVHFRYQDLQARLVSLYIFYLVKERPQ